MPTILQLPSSFAQTLPNLFLGYHEIKWLNSEESSTVLFYKQYIDYIFCLFECEADAEHFLTFLCRQHPNIKFTTKKEKNNQLPFLDILNDSSSNKLATSVYRKPTYTGLLTNYNSFTFPNYKKGLIKTLIDQTFRINSNWSGIHYDILNLKLVLQKNELPLKLIEKSISKYLNNNVFKRKENEQMLLLESPKKRFYKLPYIGNFSIQTKKKLNSYSHMMEFFYKILLSEEVFHKMNIFVFIFEKKIKFVSKILKYIFVSLNYR